MTAVRILDAAPERREAVAGWLVEQLPRLLADDPFLQRFVGIFEHVASSVHERIDGIEQHLDPGLAPPEFVQWLGGWVGLAVNASLPEERQRRLVRAAGPLLAWRGTRRALEGLLEALTGAPAQVRDRGGVFPVGQAPQADRHVVVELEDTGGIAEEHLLEFLQRELPADATVELLVTRPEAH